MRLFGSDISEQLTHSHVTRGVFQSKLEVFDLDFLQLVNIIESPKLCIVQRCRKHLESGEATLSLRLVPDVVAKTWSLREVK